MTPDSTDAGVTRRQAITAVAGGAGLFAASGTATAQTIDYGGWFAGVSNFDGTEDHTGESEVEIQVGTQANGGAFGYGPPAIHVDPGTTVRWVWTGDGGAHNVVDNDGAYSSALQTEAGATFTHTFDDDGISLYYCDPHRQVGMKGAVVVGDATAVSQGGGPTWSPPAIFDTTFVGMFFGTIAVAALGVLGVEAYARRRERHAALRPDEPIEETTEAEPTDPATEIGHDEYDPIGTAALVVLYFLVLVALWIFTYFIEFLGGGPTVVG